MFDNENQRTGESLLKIKELVGAEGIESTKKRTFNNMQSDR